MNQIQPLSKQLRKQFTGRHMTAILIVFFGVVITVNFTMASLAISSFGGTVVDNSYVASQNYNRWLANAAVQDKLGWKEAITLNPQRHVIVSVASRGVVLDGVKAAGQALHPLGKFPPIEIAFDTLSPGILISKTALPTGRWRINLTVRKNTDIAKYLTELQ